MEKGKMTVYFNGEYIAKDAVRVSPDDRGFNFGDGVYEVIRAYGGRLFGMEAHLARMERGLREMRITGVVARDFAVVCERLLELNGFSDGDANIYMQVSRGAAPRQHSFPDPAPPPTTYASVSAVKPRGDPAKGVAAITLPDQRWARCDIKTIALVPNVLANQLAKEAGAAEAVLVRDGVALEATAASLFAVFDGEVRTAPKSNYILPSITRAVALEICAENDIPARETPIFIDELRNADEIFLAGTTFEIMPVVRLDGVAVGSGTPGLRSRQIYDFFCQRTGSVALT
jgi:D-alanine transaminase